MASTYDFAYLKALVLKKLQGDVYFGTADIEDALNESQDDLALFTKAELTSTVLTLTAGQDTYDWPADALAINGVNFGGVELDEVTQEEWRRMGGLAQSNSTPSPVGPGAYAIQGRRIILYPLPGNVAPTCLVFYIPKPAELVLDTQVPTVPRVFTKAWVHLALSNLLEMDAGRLEDSKFHYQMYLQRRAENAVEENASRLRKFRNTQRRVNRF